MNNTKPINFVSSFSRSKFELINIKKKLYLKKKIKNPQKRDFQSIQKNNYFHENIRLKNVKTHYIKTTSFEELKNKKYFIMEYIDGHSGELILKNLGSEEIKLIKKFINDYFVFIKKDIKWVKINKSIIFKKIKQIKKQIKIPVLIKLFNSNRTLLLKELNNIKLYPSSYCHGDLTLSNIIVEKKNIYLIDFLKTYNDGIAQDLSKIYQEFVLGWSSRKLDERELLRSKLIYKKIIENNFFNSFPIDIRKVLKFEILMTLLRIFPYVDKYDKKTVNWLNKSLKKINKKKNISNF